MVDEKDSIAFKGLYSRTNFLLSEWTKNVNHIETPHT